VTKRETERKVTEETTNLKPPLGKAVVCTYQQRSRKKKKKRLKAKRRQNLEEEEE
jgi:hypothetical protein